MVEKATSTRKFTANACLHHSHAFPLRFLRRNLRHVLDAHERELRTQSQSSLLQRSDDAASGMIANERRAAGWDFPTKEMLDDLTKGEKPILRLDALRIRHPESAPPRRRKRDPRGDRDDARLDFIPDPEALATLPCQVTISVREEGDDGLDVYVNSVPANISQHRRSEEGHSDFDITLAEPFLIEIGKLFVATETGTNGFRSWRRTIPTGYRLDVKIQCRDRDSTTTFFTELQQWPPSDNQRKPGRDSALEARWDELPRCPSGSERLPLKRRESGYRTPVDHRLEVSMGWARKRESPLQRHHKAVMQGSAGINHQLLTPSSQNVEREARHVVTYKFCEGPATRVKTVEGLHCPLCRERPEAFKRLLLHFQTFHDHFRFDVEDTPGSDVSDGSVVRKTIVLGVSTQTQYDKVTEHGVDEKVNWVAPQRPFDAGAHVRGDDSWTGFSKPKAPKKRGRLPGPQARDSDHVSAPRPVTKRRPELDQVADLPPGRGKQHVVPNVPGVRFYHTLSKKPLAPGELISDSDEAVDEFWRMDVQRLALRELDVQGPAQEFTIAFNQHLAREQSASSLLMREAVVRFTRSHRAQLRRVEWQRPFREKLEQLQGAGVIDRAAVTHCIQLLQAGGADDDVQMMNGIDDDVTGGAKRRPNGVPAATADRSDGLPQAKAKQRVRWGMGGAVSRDGAAAANGEQKPEIPAADGGAPRPQTNGDSDSARSDAGLCTCGASARDARAAIICANVKCRRKDFHLACVGLEKRQGGWKCGECA